MSPLYALGNHTQDLNISLIDGYFENPKKSFINFMKLRGKIIENLKNQGISYTAEKIPVHHITYDFSDKNQLILKVFMSAGDNQCLESVIGGVIPDKKESLYNILSGLSEDNAELMIKGSGSYIISDIVSQFGHEVHYPYNKKGENDTKIVPNFPYKNKDKTISTGILRIGRPWQKIEKFQSILEDLLQGDESKDILITGSEFKQDYIYENLNMILKKGSGHNLFIIPTASIIQNPHLLRQCYQEAFILSINSKELTGFSTNPSWEDIDGKHKDMINGSQRDYVRLITNEEHGAYIALQENKNIYTSHISILDEKIGKDLIEKVYNLCGNFDLRSVISLDISQGVGAGDTAAGGLTTAYYNIKNGILNDYLNQYPKPKEKLKIKSYYYLIISQIMSFLTYHSKFSTFSQIKEIIGNDKFNEMVLLINTLANDQLQLIMGEKNPI